MTLSNRPTYIGGAVVVWRSDLYKEEALRQLSDTSFYAKVEKDLTANNQKIVKDTIQNVKQELPATATNLIITTPRTSCIYFLSKIHKPNNPGRPIVSACSCPTDVIILGDLNCNLLRDNVESRALNDFCSTFNLSQLINKPTRVTESGESLIDVVMTTNEKLIASNEVLMSTICDHNLVHISLKLKKPRLKPCHVTTRSYTNYNYRQFFHIISLFDDFIE